LVSARLELRRGILEAWLVNDVTEWRFADWTSPWRRLTQIVLHWCEVEFADNDTERTVNLVFTGAGKFTVKIPPKDGNVLMLIGNTLKNKADDEPDAVDHHVKLYYDAAGVAYPMAYRRELVSRAVDKLSYTPQIGLTIEQPATRALFPKVFQILKVGGANCPPGRWSE